MIIPTADGFVCDSAVIRLLPGEKNEGGRETTKLIGAIGHPIGVALGEISEVAKMLTPVVPASPGFSLILYAGEAHAGQCSTDPIVAWRIGLGDPSPICAQGSEKSGGFKAIVRPETAPRTATRAGPTSSRLSILGMSNELERRTRAILSRMIFAAVMSPLRAAVITALTIFSTSSCMSRSAIGVVLCRAPFGFPAGLPDWPF
jgi:hypothetical protein